MNFIENNSLSDLIVVNVCGTTITLDKIDTFNNSMIWTNMKNLSFLELVLYMLLK